MALGVPFGNYRLVRRIARGGMAEVFLAWQLSPTLSQDEDEGDGFYDSTTGIRFTRQVAVKRILPHLSESDEFRALFLQEARLAATLSHPNVVHIYDFGKIGDCLFLAMELIEGIGLNALCHQVAQKGPDRLLPVEHAVRIAADVLSGLHHAHTRTDAAGRPQHIVHRDVSPQNVMITLDGVVKILDFGIAKAAWSAQETRPGVIRGKYAYMSPEQAEGQKLDGRSDVYAVGVCLFELLTGTPLVPRDLPVSAALRAVRRGIAQEGLGQLELLRPDLPAGMHAILRRALQTRRDHRYASAAEFQLDLEQFLKDWPRLGSSLLLGEYVRHFQIRPQAGGFDDEQAGLVTPVMARTPSPASQKDELPETLVSDPLPSTIVNDPLLRMLAEAPALDPDTLVDPSLVRSPPTAGEAQTARVPLPTLVVSRAGLPTRPPAPVAGYPPGSATILTPIQRAQKTPRPRARPGALLPGALLVAAAGLGLLIVMLLRTCAG